MAVSTMRVRHLSEAWVSAARWVALAVFVAVPAFSWFEQQLAGRLVWTVAVAGLPLFITAVGYHRWRRICPLAFFSQVPLRLGRPGSRRANRLLRANYYYVSFSIFVSSLWLRLIATNGDGRAISAFFVAISLLAMVAGAIYTGKTWCNYLCPLSFIEKIYTEPLGRRQSRNSQCNTCTGCKAFCPDINQETAYWHELTSPAKRFVYFSFPGVVLGFYLYYYLQAGTWDYYFDGVWTNQPGLVTTAFLPGHDGITAGLFFFPQLSRAAAALMVLSVCAAGSFLLFSAVEALASAFLRGRVTTLTGVRIRHYLFAAAGFSAFLTFYSFAGAPTLLHAPGIWAIWVLAVIAVASLTLVRRLGYSIEAAPNIRRSSAK